jgi:hypothetical protein
MVKISKFNSGYRWGVALTTAAIAALFAPHLLEHLNSKFTKKLPLTGLSGSISPQAPVNRMTDSLDANELFIKLENADAQWQPQEELLPDGSTRFLYKRRVGESDLSVSELRSLINDPPTFQTERQAITNLLETLRQAGVRVMLTPTIKKGAAAEWDHRDGVMRIQPQVTEKGSLDFLRVLNHEAIHVAQSCRSGSLVAKPKALGVTVLDDKAFRSTLDNPVYANVSVEEKILELEAYSLQNDVTTANTLVSKECKVKNSALLNKA